MKTRILRSIVGGFIFMAAFVGVISLVIWAANAIWPTTVGWILLVGGSWFLGGLIAYSEGDGL
jgi:hypothetical protein